MPTLISFWALFWPQCLTPKAGGCVCGGGASVKIIVLGPFLAWLSALRHRTPTVPCDILYSTSCPADRMPLGACYPMVCATPFVCFFFFFFFLGFSHWLHQLHARARQRLDRTALSLGDHRGCHPGRHRRHRRASRRGARKAGIRPYCRTGFERCCFSPLSVFPLGDFSFFFYADCGRHPPLRLPFDFL